jgi:hypothetical protein
MFEDWLAREPVVEELSLLLEPSGDAELDRDLLRAEFEAAGYDPEWLGNVDFDQLLDLLVGGFAAAAQKQDDLIEPLKLNLLRDMAERMGALNRLEQVAQEQLRAEREAVNSLARIQALTEELVEGRDVANQFLQEIVSTLQDSQVKDNAWQQAVYAAVREALDKAQKHSTETLDTGRIEALLKDIRDTLSRVDDTITPRELAEMETNYRKRIVEQFETLTFKGISPSGRPIALRLRDIYVELKAVAEVPEAADTFSADERRLLLEAEGRSDDARAGMLVHLDALRLQRWKAEARGRQGRQEPLQRCSIHQTLADPNQRGVVILGDPGSGKTTLLHFLALSQAGGAVTGTQLPIFVPLAAYDDHLRRSGGEISLAEFLAIYYEKWQNLPGLRPLFESALNEGRTLVLLDGLDEVLDVATRQHVAEQAGALISRWTPRGNRFALTSRIVGYREARLPGNLPHVTVLDFGPTEIDVFATQWTRAYEIWVAGNETPAALQRAATEREALLDDVHSNDSVERLASTPLLLTMLALLRRHVGKLPDRRIELYERYTRTLIENWELVRAAGARRRKPERFDPYKAIDHLIELALWLQREHPSGTARTADLERELARICLRYEGIDPVTAKNKQSVEAQREAERFLKDMRHFAGLLAERGRDAFGFLHLTFQEYYAGRALARMEPAPRWEILQPNLHNPRWREPILLCAGQLGVSEGRRDAATALISQVLDARSEHEPILHRDLFLAVAIASDDVGLTPALRDDLATRLAPIASSRIPAVRNNALAGLTQLARLGCDSAQETLLAGLDDSQLCYPAMRVVGRVLSEPVCAQLRIAITAKLEDDDADVRLQVVEALLPLFPDAAIQQSLLPWLGIVLEPRHRQPDEDMDGSRTRRLLAEAFARVVPRNPDLLVSLSSMLDSPAWPARQGAAMALVAMPGGPPLQFRSRLLGLLDERRGEESWPERLQVAGLLINDRDRELSQHAIHVALEALDYATQPWYHLPRAGGEVRRQAATILGSLEPLYRDEAVFTRLARVLEEDENANVRDAAYGALLRLAAAPEQSESLA